MDRLTEALMIHLSAIVNKSGLHPLDEDAVIAGFKALAKNGIAFDPDEVTNLATAHGWQPLALKYLEKAVTDIQNGVNKRIKHGAKIPTLKQLEEMATRGGL
ncbi:MAG: hypothetical protein RRB13_07080 [bacterium]|nr:hypothetical protein [bacterium]